MSVSGAILVAAATKNGVWEPTVKDSLPDVIIQFRWTNKKGYQEEAIDDRMDRSLERDCGNLSTIRPVVGYLIRVKFSRNWTLSGAMKARKRKTLQAWKSTDRRTWAYGYLGNALWPIQNRGSHVNSYHKKRQTQKLAILGNLFFRLLCLVLLPTTCNDRTCPKSACRSPEDSF